MPATSLAASSRPQRLYTLDLLRFIAAMAVVLFHYVGTTDGGPWSTSASQEFPVVSQLAGFGYLGVKLFFVVSGFVILMSAWGRSLREFIASRIARLYPAYWVALVLTGVIFVFLRTGSLEDVNSRRILINASMLQTGFGVADVSVVYWTLWVELCFYLMIGLLLSVGMTYARLLAVIALWPLIGAVIPTEGLGGLLQGTHSAYFAGGMALYLIYAFGHSWVRWSLVGLNVVIAVGTHASGSPDSHYKTISAGLIILLFAIVAVAVLTRARSWAGNFGSVTGRLTYPLYLIHVTVGYFIIERLDPFLASWAVLILAIGASITVAWGINKFVEKPLAGRIRSTVEKGLRTPVGDSVSSVQRNLDPSNSPR